MEVVNCLLCFILVTSLPVCFCTTYITTTSGSITNGQLAVNSGSSISLICTVNKGMNGEDGSALWDRSSIPLTYNDNLLQDADKYGITKRDSPTGNHTRYILTIRRVTLMDEGNYTCQNIKVTPPETRGVHVSVSFPPTSFRMTHNGIDVMVVTALEGESSDIVCTSIGSRPETDIWWYHRIKGGNFTRITNGVSQNATTNPDDTARFDTISTLQYINSKEFNGGELKCEVNGMEWADNVDAISYLNIQFEGTTKTNLATDELLDVPLTYTDELTAKTNLATEEVLEVSPTYTDEETANTNLATEEMLDVSPAYTVNHGQGMRSMSGLGIPIGQTKTSPSLSYSQTLPMMNNIHNIYIHHSWKSAIVVLSVLVAILFVAIIVIVFVLAAVWRRQTHGTWRVKQNALKLRAQGAQNQQDVSWISLPNISDVSGYSERDHTSEERFVEHEDESQA
ncbi:uncharacterized protein [Amphiura filiformis]|uniref:uncharacterized protein n=1 Tax=Amphiura filiformis TaxID=82378 RepID=UPI003B211B57